MGPTYCTKQTNREKQCFARDYYKNQFFWSGRKGRDWKSIRSNDWIYDVLSCTKIYHKSHQTDITVIYTHIGKLMNKIICTYLDFHVKTDRKNCIKDELNAKWSAILR